MESTTATMTELASREGDGVEVALLWSRSDNRLTVVVNDWKGGESFELPVTGENALDVFYHPYAYAAFHGVDYAHAT